MTITVGLAIFSCAATGLALALGIRNIRQRREYRRLDGASIALHHRLQAHDDALYGLQEHIAELGPALIDAQRRWGFDLTRWPDVNALIGNPSPSAVSWWLLQHAPGIEHLSDGAFTTETFYGDFKGWRPPALAANGRVAVASGSITEG